MKQQQLSVFAENRLGSVTEATGILRDANVNIRALCIADTTDFGIVRLIVDQPELAAARLRAAGLVANVTEVLGVKMEDAPGAFHNILSILFEAGIEVEYTYAYLAPAPERGAYVILRTREDARAVQALRARGVGFIGDAE